MFRTVSSATALCLASILSAVGCSSQDVAGVDAKSDDVSASPFVLQAKLYENAKPNIDATCDAYVALAVRRETSSGALTATLENRLSPSSTCEIEVDPNPRSYVVKSSRSSCGSTVYATAQATPGVAIIDGRISTCAGFGGPVLSIVETLADGNKLRFFGEPTAEPTPPPVAPADASLLTVHLYGQPKATPNASCDVYTKLTVAKQGDRIVGTVRAELSGSSLCEIYVLPNERSYDLAKGEDGCGSTVYVGSDGADSLTVKDNRERLCEDVRPDVVEVRESRNGDRIDLYGRP